MASPLSRRELLRRAALAAATWGLPPGSAGPTSGPTAEPRALFTISLAEWSLHRAILRQRTLDHLDFARTAREVYGIDAVEYVNQMFADQATDRSYLAEMKRRGDDAGVRSLLIMCDGEGELGDPDAAARARAVDNHRKWAEAARFLGCHAIRVNAASAGSWDEQVKLAADGLSRLAEHCAALDLDCLVENHGGLSSNGAWLAAVMRAAAHPRCGTLPDFGNFRIAPGEEYDRYRGVDELMPFARAVSAKSNDFDERGEERHTDYRRMLEIVCRRHHYRGWIGIEYEGEQLAEPDGIRATQRLLERVRDELASA